MQPIHDHLIEHDLGIPAACDPHHATPNALHPIVSTAAYAADHDGPLRRERILQLIAANPGIHVRAIATLSGLSWHTCHHHVRHLAANHLVRQRRFGGRLCCFDSSGAPVTQWQSAIVLRNARGAALAQAVQDHPGRDESSLAAALAMQISAVSRTIDRLAGAGLVVRVPAGRRRLIFAGPGLAAALDAARSGPSGRNAQTDVGPTGPPTVEDIAAAASCEAGVAQLDPVHRWSDRRAGPPLGALAAAPVNT